MKIPDNYRKLKSDEIIREGDIYQNIINPSIIAKTHNSIGKPVRHYTNYIFFRRRHTKQSVSRAVITTKPDATKKPIVIVSFRYPHRGDWDKFRIVQVISLNEKYLVGLERTEEDNGKYSYQFKKFLRNRISSSGAIQLESYNPPA
jgi:hypothetical protein